MLLSFSCMLLSSAEPGLQLRARHVLARPAVPHTAITGQNLKQRVESSMGSGTAFPCVLREGLPPFAIGWPRGLSSRSTARGPARPGSSQVCWQRSYRCVLSVPLQWPASLQGILTTHTFNVHEVDAGESSLEDWPTSAKVSTGAVATVTTVQSTESSLA